MLSLIGKIGRQKWAQLDIYFSVKDPASSTAAEQQKLTLSRDEVIGHIDGLLQAHMELKTVVNAECVIKRRSRKRRNICDRVMDVLQKLERRGVSHPKGHVLSVELKAGTMEVFMALPCPVTKGVVKLADGKVQISKYRVDY